MTGRYEGRERIVVTAMRVLLALRSHGSGRPHPLKMTEIADMTGIHWRTAYRIVRAIEAAGIKVERRKGGKYWIRRSEIRRVFLLGRAIDTRDRAAGRYP